MNTVSVEAKTDAIRVAHHLLQRYGANLRHSGLHIKTESGRNENDDLDSRLVEQLHVEEPNGSALRPKGMFRSLRE